MLEVDRRTGTAKPAGFKTRHDRARDAEHEMLNKFISTGDRTEQEIKKREDRRARKRGPETEHDKMNKLRQSMFIFSKTFCIDLYSYLQHHLQGKRIHLSIMIPIDIVLGFRNRWSVVSCLNCENQARLLTRASTYPRLQLYWHWVLNYNNAKSTRVLMINIYVFFIDSILGRATTAKS